MKKKKDVLFLCQYFYPEFISSATLPLDVALALANHNFKVATICGYPKEYNMKRKVPLKEKYKSIEIKRLRYLQLKRTRHLGRIINYFSFTIAVLLRLLELRKYKSIIVYSNPPVLPLIAVLANKLFKTKVIFVCFDVYPEIAHVTNSIKKNSFISRLMGSINKITYKDFSKVVALSNEMKDYLLTKRRGLSEKQMEVIPNWYEDKGKSEIIDSSKNKLFRAIKKKGVIVISYFGNMGTCQDLDTIVDAIRSLKDDHTIQFIFAGHGTKFENLKMLKQIEELENLHIFEFLHGNEFQEVLNLSDCFLVSLVEGVTGLAVPSKTYSYMMIGRPIIAIMEENADIVKDLTKNNAGYSLKVGESYKLVNAIYDLKNNKHKRELMGENCRNIFLEKYTREKCTQQYVKMIQEVLEGNYNVQG